MNAPYSFDHKLLTDLYPAKEKNHKILPCLSNLQPLYCKCLLYCNLLPHIIYKASGSVCKHTKMLRNFSNPCPKGWRIHKRVRQERWPPGF